MKAFRHLSAGMTLLENLVAATIILLVLLSLLGTIAFSLQGVRNAEGNQDAVLYARRLFELIRERRLAQAEIFPPAIGFSDPPEARVSLDGAPFDSNDDFPSDSGYTRRIVTQRISSDPGDHRSKLYRIEVTVFWEVKGRENNFRLVGYYRAP